MNKTVVAIFNSADEAQDAADQLSAKGFSRDHIDVFSGRNSTALEYMGLSLMVPSSMPLIRLACTSTPAYTDPTGVVR